MSRVQLRALGVLAAMVMLCRCSSASTPVAGSAMSNERRSWMAPAAKQNDLLYVSNFYGDDVTVYTYPSGDFVGTLTGFDRPMGECSDRSGNVFVTNYGNFNIVEYAHGGTMPIATLDDYSGRPKGCTIDPATGNLAVTTLETKMFDPGSLAIYPNASGFPRTYRNPKFFYYYFCTYDTKGNVYVDGSSEYSSQTQGAVLGAGVGKLQSMKFDHNIADVGGIQWDGKYLAIGAGNTALAQIVYRFRISGTGGKLEGTTDLNGAEDVVQFWIQGGERNKGATLIGPDFAGEDVGYYRYPEGGSPFKTITQGLDAPFGVTISRAR